ncbi:tumor necrosis factor receptor superfamily member 10B isoform X5 [Fukomys damarensis]|uniref:tumor necrosis factor receptor superfamily member 10B isoform X5 n=1 Tax=Fukomys damarensis TaxID=885580 RepID=UPI00053FA31A|nr:tumor necrosis factor receptor superfamily member 10B isoform X5 [Fukomys damarensis]
MPVPALSPQIFTEQVITSEAHEPPDLQRWELSPQHGFCPAGSYLSEKSRQCEECEEGVDYTSHPNELPACIPCRVCAQEERQEHPCNKTTNTVCYCKNGTFRAEGSPEFCQKCQTRCPNGKVMVSPCAPRSDLKCVDKESGTKTTAEAPAPGEPVTGSPGTPASPCPSIAFPVICGIAVVSLLAVAVAVAVLVWKAGWWRLCGQSSIFSSCEQDSELGDTHDEHEIEQQEQIVTRKGVPEQRAGETERLLGPAEAERSPVRRKPLVPASGVDPSEALRRLFTYCAEVVDHNSWDRFMQELGLTPNEIFLARVSRPHDPLYEMLQKWLNKTGRNASLNTLLGALDKLGQKLAKEKMVEYAVNSGNFIYQEDGVIGVKELF